MVWRAALIGCGKIGSEYADDPKIKGIYSHAGAYAANQRTRLVAVCDADPMRAAACARRWDLSTSYTEVSELLAREQPQLVSICTPDATHAGILRTVLTADSVRAVLAEKPLATDPTEAEELCQLARQRNVVLAVNYIRRYAAGHRQVAALIERGALGTLRSVTGLYSGGVVHNGSHWFDLVRWLVGEIVMVEGRMTAESAPSGEPDGNVDVAMRFANGARGYLFGYDPGAYAVFEMDIVGTSGRIRITDAGHQIEVLQAGESPHVSGYRTLQPSTRLEGGLANVMVHAVEDLLSCCESGAQPLCSGRDGVAALQLAHAALSSARAGSPCVLARP